MSRESMLARIRLAVGEVPPPVIAPRRYARAGTMAPAGREVIDLLVDRLTDYRAAVRVVGEDDLAGGVDAALADARSVVVPAGLGPGGAVRAACESGGRRVVVDGEPAWLSAIDLDRLDAVVTAATVAIAVNGAIVLDAGADQGRRIISLVPDRHVIVLRADQIVQTVPEGLARLDPGRPITMIAGPSATSDIELHRVEGVHGPRTLEVIILR